LKEEQMLALTDVILYRTIARGESHVTVLAFAIVVKNFIVIPEIAISVSDAGLTRER